MIAAELLLKHDYRDEALEALRDVAETGDEHWAMVDAASILYEHERTSENRQILTDLCVVDEDSPPDRIFASTLSRLMAIGEAELALPHLEAATQLPDEASYRALSFDEAVEAARSIAVHHDRSAGKQVLERMLASSGTMRATAEVASALADLGFEQEAKSALYSSLRENEFQIDWFTIGLLIRLNMESEARSTVETTVAHLLDGRHHVYEAVSLIEHALPILDKETMSAFVLSRARFLKESMLARSLALLGASEQARSLLSGFLNDEDVDLRIRAAGELCELGDARLGRRHLRAITRDKCVAARDRAAAAEQLKRVGLLRHAAIAFARIARDSDVAMDQRSHAAIAFDELEHQRNDVVWHPLMRVMKDQTRPVADRVNAAETLIHIDGDDGYDDLVYPELLAMLDDGQLSDSDILCVGTSLGKYGWTLDEMPRVQQLLASATVSPSAKIRALRGIGRYGKNTEVEPLLLEIAARGDSSVELSLEAIDAIWRSDANSEAQAFLDQIVRDPMTPPAWRLKAAKERAPDLRSDSLFCLAGDHSIDIGTRVAALEALPKKAIEGEGLLEDIANTVGLTFWDRKMIAEAAHRLKMPDLARSVVQSAKDDRPLSIWERNEIVKICRELDDEAGADQMLLELLSLPLVILESSEDSETIVESIRLAAKLDRDLAVRRLEELLLSDETSWWAIPDILEALTELVGHGPALAKAAPIIDELRLALQTSADEEYSGWPHRAGHLVKRGMFEDYAALLTFGENEGNRITERAEACALVIRYAEIGSSLHETAQHTLSQLYRDDLTQKDQIAVVRELRLTGCRQEMSEWLDRCLLNPPKEPDDRRALAGLLHDLGRAIEAKTLAENLDASVFVEGFMFRTDKALAESVLGAEVANETTLAQIMSNDDPFDQLWRAKEYVEEHGDRRALKLILDAANPNDDRQVQLEAIDCLDQLGFRKLSRELFAAMSREDIEPYWLGAQLLRFGKKAEAIPLYVEAGRSSIEYNENLIWGGLADLGLEAELMSSRSRYEIAAGATPI